MRRGRGSCGFPGHQPAPPAQELPPGPSRPRCRGCTGAGLEANPLLRFTTGWVLRLLHRSQRGRLAWDPAPWGCRSPALSCSLPLVPCTILVFSSIFHQLRALAAREKTPREKDARGCARFCFLAQALLTPRMLCPLLALGALALSLAGERGWGGFGLGVICMSPPRRRCPECHVHLDKAAFDLWFLVAVPTRWFSWFRGPPAAQGITPWV